MLVRQDRRRPLVADIQQVGFDHVEVGEEDVEWCVENPATRMLFKIRPQQPVQVSRNLLVLRVRRRCHVVFSVDDLMPLPIVSEQQEIVVGELHVGGSGLHALLSGHALIVYVGESEPRAMATRDVCGRIRSAMIATWSEIEVRSADHHRGNCGVQPGLQRSAALRRRCHRREGSVNGLESR
jgi:hypothetical protein